MVSCPIEDHLGTHGLSCGIFLLTHLFRQGGPSADQLNVPLSITTSSPSDTKQISNQRVFSNRVIPVIHPHLPPVDSVLSGCNYM